MNERIRELAVQAGADFMRRINYNNLEGKEYEEDAGVIFDSNDSFEKFAELLIQQCAHVAVFKDSGTVATAAVAGHMAAGRSIAAKLIKEHFGVEE